MACYPLFRSPNWENKIRDSRPNLGPSSVVYRSKVHGMVTYGGDGGNICGCLGGCLQNMKSLGLNIWARYNEE